MSTKAIFIITTIISTLIAIIAIMASIHASNTNKLKHENELMKAEMEKSNARMRDLENMCNTLEDTEKRREKAYSELIKKQEEATQKNVESIKQIESSMDACDWLDELLPESLRMQLDRSCAIAIENDSASIRND